jgi:hypothetical protein
VPEPWSGHIQNAAVLFVSSNPSIDPAEAYAVGDWEDPRRVDFFAGRFDRRALPLVDRRMRPLLATAPPAQRDKGTRFWFAARARASELLERPAEPESQLPAAHPRPADPGQAAPPAASLDKAGAGPDGRPPHSLPRALIRRDLRDRPSHNGSDMHRPEWIFGAFSS